MESYQALAAALGEDHARTKVARQRVVDLYEAWGKPEQAAPFREAPTGER